MSGPNAKVVIVITFIFLRFLLQVSAEWCDLGGGLVILTGYPIIIIIIVSFFCFLLLKLKYFSQFVCGLSG